MKRKNNNISKLLLLALFIQVLNNSNAQGDKHNIFKKEELKLYKEQSDTTKKLIEREDTSLILFSFFEKFNDNVVLFVNDLVINKWSIYEKNNPSQSSGYSGVRCQLILKDKVNKITIKLMNQRKYVDFYIDKRYPHYTIQRYNHVWYINARKYIMILK